MADRDPLGDGPLPDRTRVIVWILILSLALALRLASWGEVFGPGRVAFVPDSDPNYHVLRAERLLQEWPRLSPTDPLMNYPRGAVILWPPLFDGLIALPGWLLGGTREALERVAVVLPVALGLATIPLVAALGSTLIARRAGLVAAGVTALLPANVGYTILGRADQHCLELLLFCWIVLAFVRAWRADPGSRVARRSGPLLLGGGIAAAFWNWQGSGLYLLLLLAFVTALRLAGPGSETGRRAALALARGAAAGAGLLGLSMAFAAPEALRSTAIMGVTAFHLVLVALTAASAGLLSVAPRWFAAWEGPLRRALEVAGAGLLPLALALVVVPGFGESVQRGLTALAASNPWYESIGEFQPMLLSGGKPLAAELRFAILTWGLTLAVMPPCALAMVRAWRTRGTSRPEIAFLAFWGTALLGLAAWRYRFQLYAVVPAALWLALGLRELAAWLASRERARSPAAPVMMALLAGCAVVAPSLPGLAPGFIRKDGLVAQSLPVLGWLRDQAPPTPTREAVLAPWYLGHAVRYYAGKPVITSPFGTDGGEGAMEAAARFYLASGPEAAEIALADRRVGWVLLRSAGSETAMLAGFAPWIGVPPARRTRDWRRGSTLDVSPALWELPASQLYYLDGAGVPGTATPGLGGFRLLYEVRPPGAAQEGWVKLFGVVRGASLEVNNARPGSRVVVTVPVITNEGRRFAWQSRQTADASGRTRARVPYATGANGQVRALAARVTDGQQVLEIELDDRLVSGGGVVALELASAPSRPVQPR